MATTIVIVAILATIKPVAFISTGARIDFHKNTQVDFKMHQITQLRTLCSNIIPIVICLSFSISLGHI